MSKYLLLLSMGILSLPVYPQSASFDGEYVACLTEDLFDQFTSTLAAEDEDSRNDLLKNGCFIMPKSGISLSALDPAALPTGKVQVLAYVDGEPVFLWTNLEYHDR